MAWGYSITCLNCQYHVLRFPCNPKALWNCWLTVTVAIWLELPITCIVLNIVSKLLECLALCRLRPQLTGSSNFSKMQSAFRSGCSTETTLLSILDGLYQTIDNKETAVLVSLDLSAAFDTVSHNILLNRLNAEFGVRGTALAWIKSYLSDCHQFVKIGRHRSESVSYNLGLPQGSVLVLGPVADPAIGGRGGRPPPLALPGEGKPAGFRKLIPTALHAWLTLLLNRNMFMRNVERFKAIFATAYSHSSPSGLALWYLQYQNNNRPVP
jgi:Reverse transcriptase (RNA-dependent DNA polymerase)